MTERSTSSVPHKQRERFHPETPDAWWRWLDSNHNTSTGVWLVSWKQKTGKPSLTYEEIVESALAFGWIDAQAGTLDDERSMLWMAPRKPRSAWSRPNKERIARLEKTGRMQPAGRAAIDAAKDNGAWTLLDDVWDLVVPEDLAAALEKQPGARDAWESFPPSSRRAMLEWIVQAKRDDTRRKRVDEIADKAARGERAR